MIGILPRQLKLKKKKKNHTVYINEMKKGDYFSTTYVKDSYGHRCDRNKILRIMCAVFSIGGKE